jgi:hypothetical protein
MRGWCETVLVVFVEGHHEPDGFLLQDHFLHPRFRSPQDRVEVVFFDSSTSRINPVQVLLD